MNAPKWVPNWIDEVDYVPPDLAKCREMVPVKYHDLLNVFSKANAESLPSHTEDDIKIDLLPNTSPPFGGIYCLATQEQCSLK